jgi:hypothetical protein
LSKQERDDFTAFLGRTLASHGKLMRAPPARDKQLMRGQAAPTRGRCKA